jgi:EpsI family protein
MSLPPSSPSLSRRRFLFAGALSGGLLLSEGLRLLPSEARAEINVEALTPDEIGRWRRVVGPEMVLPREDAGSKFYEQEVARTYGGDGLPMVMLSIAYGSRQDERLEVHRPETCYPAQGFQLAEGRPAEVGLRQGMSIPARFLLARRPDRVEQILYWTRIGDMFPRSSVEQKLALLRSTVELKVPDGILVRISTLGEQVEDFSMMTDFARRLLEASPIILKRALMGPLVSALPLEGPKNAVNIVQGSK